MQLVAYGAQDIYLTGNPQITFFKVVYRRHTNFSMESIKQTLVGNKEFGEDITATISRNGDLIYRMYLEHSLDNLEASSNANDVILAADYGSRLVKEAELEIGGQKIDRHFGHWHSVYSQLTEPNPIGKSDTLYNKKTGNGGVFTSAARPDDPGRAWNGLPGAAGNPGKITGRIFVPFLFWFCRNPGLALPLIALQYHEVKLKLRLEEQKFLISEIEKGDENSTDANLLPDATVNLSASFDLWCDYIYLDTDERRRFAQVSHEYLIEQLQYVRKIGGKTMDLNFNHPVKELIWSSVRKSNNFEAPAPLTDGGITENRLGQYGENWYGKKPLTNSYKITLNGQDRIRERKIDYFTKVQIWEHHSGFGGLVANEKMNPDPTHASLNPIIEEGYNTIAVYSFALKPEEHQPSGTCNFSRIDTAQLVESTTASKGTDLDIYAVNYNVLRIMSGMGGLAYSN